MTDYVIHEFDLTAHEVSRRAEVLNAIPDWDPVAVLDGEADAYALLYSGLDPAQTTIYSELRAAGVLP